jgi:monofunctional glycosyltransferase
MRILFLKSSWPRVAAITAGIFALAFGIWLWWAPGLEKLATVPPATSRLMDLRRQEAKRQHHAFRADYRWVALSRIAPALRQAVVVSEDDMFYQHEGLDWEEIRAAWEQNLRRGHIRRGASTITQQVAKNLFLSPRKTLPRKLKEAVLAMRLEHRLGKRRILELYLNLAEWGPGLFGAEAASQHYFQKPASELSWEEAVALAAVLPSPLRHSPLQPDRFTEFRQTWINQRLLEKGILAPSPILAVTALSPVSPTTQPADALLPLPETAGISGNTLAGAALQPSP